MNINLSSDCSSLYPRYYCSPSLETSFLLGTLEMSSPSATRLKNAVQIIKPERYHRDAIYSRLAWTNLKH